MGGPPSPPALRYMAVCGAYRPVSRAARDAVHTVAATKNWSKLYELFWMRPMMFGNTVWLSAADWLAVIHIGGRIWSTMTIRMFGFFRTCGGVQPPVLEAAWAGLWQAPAAPKSAAPARRSRNIRRLMSSWSGILLASDGSLGYGQGESGGGAARAGQDRESSSNAIGSERRSGGRAAGIRRERHRRRRSERPAGAVRSR